MNVENLPSDSGIYAIVNTTNGHRYVGQATNIRARVMQHLNDLRRGKEATNQGRLLQRAWDSFGENAFIAEVLAIIHNNKADTNYHIRPDNLSLAEHFYTNERAEYNADRAIVRREFHALVNEQSWRERSQTVPKSDGDRGNVTSAGGAVDALNSRAYTYLVAERKTRQHAVLVLASDERSAKARAKQLDHILRALQNNISCWRLSQAAIAEHLTAGAIDYRGHDYLVEGVHDAPGPDD